jgi:hypothetical protein
MLQQSCLIICRILVHLSKSSVDPWVPWIEIGYKRLILAVITSENVQNEV